MLFVRVCNYDVYDIRISHHRPTWLGRQFGYRGHFTVHQINGLFGGWLINGSFTGSEPITIGEQPVLIRGTDCDVTIRLTRRHWHDDIKCIIHCPSEGIDQNVSHIPSTRRTKLRLVG